MTARPQCESSKGERPVSPSLGAMRQRVRSFSPRSLVVFAASMLLLVSGSELKDRSSIALAQRVGDDAHIARSGTIVRGPVIAPLEGARDVMWSEPIRPDAVRAGASLPVVGDGAIFGGGEHGTPGSLSAIDERTGTTRWTSDTLARPQAYADGIVFGVTSYRRFDVSEIVAVDSRSGRVRWRTPGTWVAIVRQLALVTNGPRLEARDAATGRLSWSSVWGGTNPQTSMLVGTTLYLQTYESGAILHGVVYAYDIRTGRARWMKNGNKVIGALEHDRVALDVTLGPSAYAAYAPLEVAVVAVATGDVESSVAYAPDRDTIGVNTNGDIHVARNVSADSTSLTFGIGDAATYRYPVSRDPYANAGIRFDLRSALSLGGDLYLVRTPHGSAALARFADDRVVTQPLAGLGAVDSTFAFGTVGLIVSGNDALVVDSRSPTDLRHVRLPCGSITNAYVADGAIVAVCTAPESRLVGIALPRRAVPAPIETPIPVVSGPAPPRLPDVRAVSVPTRFSQLRGAAFAPDGTLWFGERVSNIASSESSHATDRIAHLEADGRIVEYPVPTEDAGIGAIVRGPDGSMWFTENDALKLGRISDSGAITEFALPGSLFKSPTYPVRGPSLVPLPAPTATMRGHPLSSRRFAKLGGLVSGEDGALWVTAPSVDALVRVTTTGIVRIITLPSGLEHPSDIGRGPHGTLWFTSRNAIGRYDASGAVHAYPVDVKRQVLTSITWGPDGNVWFSFFDGRVGRITLRGEQRVFPAPVVAGPRGMLIGGCDGSLYAADPFSRELWRVSTSGVYEMLDVPYAIGFLARSSSCTLGFIEAQAPNESHVGTIQP